MLTKVLNIGYMLPPIILGGLMFAAQVSPVEAASNISSWLLLLSLPVPSFLMYETADTWLFWWAFSILIAYIIGVTPLFVRKLLHKETLEVFLLPVEGQIDLQNKGKQNIYLHGSRFADTPKNIMEKPRIIPVGCHYYFLLDELEKQARGIIGTNGKKSEAFEVYISDLSQNYYIAKFILLIKIENSVFSVHTQQLGINRVNGSRSF